MENIIRVQTEQNGDYTYYWKSNFDFNKDYFSCYEFVNIEDIKFIIETEEIY